MERKKLLDETVEENDRISVSRYIDEKRIDLYNLVVKEELDGVVAKHKDSKYYFDKRTKDWMKIKYLQDDDYVICGYAFNHDGMNNLFLGQYNDNQLIYKGNVSLGVSGQNFRKIMNQPELITSTILSFTPNNKIIWIKPDLVATVSYMYKTSSGALRQPVFKGIREDKLPNECLDME